MKTIYKYTLAPEPIQAIKIPVNARILTVAAQGPDAICIWAEVDTDNWLDNRAFEVFMTGQEMKQDVGISRLYLGTAFLPYGIVAHVYERL